MTAFAAPAYAGLKLIAGFVMRLLFPLLLTALAGCTASSPPAEPDRRVTYRPGLDLYLFEPEERVSKAPWPTVLLFHGGAWQFGDASQFFPQCAEFRKQGFLCISAAYRVRSRDGTRMDDAVADARDALGHVLDHAGELHVDTRRVIVGGGSAGGQLAIMSLAAARQRQIPILALLLFNPVLDMSPGTPDHEPAGENWRAYSPIHQLNPGLPPMIIFQGTGDLEVVPRTAADYCQQVRRNGGRCRVEWSEGQPHGFFNRSRSRYYFYQTLWKSLRFIDELSPATAQSGWRRFARLCD